MSGIRKAAALELSGVALAVIGVYGNALWLLLPAIAAFCAGITVPRGKGG